MNIGDIVFVKCQYPVGSDEKVFGNVGVITAINHDDYQIDCGYWFSEEEIRLATESEIKREFIRMKKGEWR